MKNRRILRILYEIAVLLLVLVLLAGGLFELGFRLMPVRARYGAVWSSYLREPEDSIDVLFLGSSRAYCNIIPARIYENTGIRSYVMAGPSQTVPLTYYYLRECLKTQSPRLVLVEVSCAYVASPQEYSMANVCYMPASLNRIRAAQTCEKGILKLALFPLEEFHGRIYGGEETETPEQGLMLCGFTPMFQAREQTERPFRELNVHPGDEQYENNLRYLRQIAELCREKEIRCVFFTAPTMRPFPEEENRRLLADLAALDCDGVEDWADLIGEIGIDPAADWYDTIHFNLNGAWKFTDYLSDYLRGFELPTGGDPDPELWARRVAYIHEQKLLPMT